MTITQTVEVPLDHRLTIDVPREVPTGATAHCEIRWFPRKETSPTSPTKVGADGGADFHAALEEIRELCKDAPISVDSFLEMRRQELELEEQKFRRLYPEAGDGA